MTWNYYTSISPRQVQVVGEEQTQRQKNIVALALNASLASTAHCQDLTAPAQTNSVEKLNKGTQHPAKKKIILIHWYAPAAQLHSRNTKQL